MPANVKHQRHGIQPSHYKQYLNEIHEKKKLFIDKSKSQSGLVKSKCD